MSGWDYSDNGMYFITLVTKNRDCNLGKIVKMEWLKSFEIRNELFCDEYIIMPNHIHAIVIIDNDGDDTCVPLPSTAISQKPFVRSPKSISSFIGEYKSAINTKIDNFIDEYNLDIPKYNRNNHFFQPNYNDRIIRNEIEYNQIKNYIINF